MSYQLIGYLSCDSLQETKPVFKKSGRFFFSITDKNHRIASFVALPPSVELSEGAAAIYVFKVDDKTIIYGTFESYSRRVQEHLKKG